MDTAISFERVGVRYDGAPRPTLHDVDLAVEEGSLCLVIGRTGAGKSTLLGAVNGLVPHFTGGRLTGRVSVDGHDTRTHRPRDLAHVVGVVGQDPLAGFVTDTVEEELAYSMEQLAVAPGTMRARVEETLDLLGIAELRHRPLSSLSGGQQQRVAIAAVLTAQPRVLVLDEPTSALDPTAAEDALAAITRLVHDVGITVLIAEHRMERVVQYADQVAYLPGDSTVRCGDPAAVLATSAVAPPVVELGRLAGWRPPPRSVRDARRLAGPLRRRLAGHAPAPRRQPTGPALVASRITVRYGGLVAVRALSLELSAGQVTALMGRNGSGKTSLLWAVQGSGDRHSGTVRVGAAGTDPASLPARRARTLVGLVPQTPADLLYRETVAAECAQADADAAAAPGTCRALLTRLAPEVADAQHPADLSEGQRLGLVLAVQLTAAPRVLLLDEPTRGLDYHAKRRLGGILAEQVDHGRAVLLSTHDVEFVAAVADRVVVLADGDIVADGRTPEIIGASPALAPQVSKVLHPAPWLTVDEVAGALGAPGAHR